MNPKCPNHKNSGATYYFNYQRHGKELRGYYCDECVERHAYKAFMEPIPTLHKLTQEKTPQIILSVGKLDQQIQEAIKQFGGKTQTVETNDQSMYLVIMPETTRYETNEGRHIYVIHDGQHNTLGVYELVLSEDQNIVKSSLVEW